MYFVFERSITALEVYDEDMNHLNDMLRKNVIELDKPFDTNLVKIYDAGVQINHRTGLRDKTILTNYEDPQTHCLIHACEVYITDKPSVYELGERPNHTLVASIIKTPLVHKGEITTICNRAFKNYVEVPGTDEYREQRKLEFRRAILEDRIPHLPGVASFINNYIKKYLQN